MDYISISGVRPWDGRYEFDLEGGDLTTREWGWIKRHSGYLPLTIDDGFEGADPELFATFAAIALFRAGKITAREVPEVFEKLADAPFGSTITLEADKEGEPVKENPSRPNSPASENTSGTDGRTNSDRSDVLPKPTGTPDLATSASVPVRLAN